MQGIELLHWNRLRPRQLSELYRSAGEATYTTGQIFGAVGGRGDA
jgi:hypothetical protein